MPPKPAANSTQEQDAMPVAEALAASHFIGSKAFVSEEHRREQCKRVISLVESGESESAACKMVGIARTTFRQAIGKHDTDASYARALVSLAHHQVEKLEEILEDMEAGKIDPQQARVAVDTRKWIASKFLPRQYGDKVVNEISGPNGGTVQVETINPLDLIEAKLAKLIAARPQEDK